MNKTRLIQIINKLVLSPTDKKDLINIINTKNNIILESLNGNGAIIFNISNPEHNLKIVQEIGNDAVLCDLFLDTVYVGRGNYDNGYINILVDNYIHKYNVDFNDGSIKISDSINLDFVGREVKLDVCTAGSQEAARNLEKLNTAYFEIGDHFTVNIDAGIGVAKFIPDSGGEGHITTAEGVNVHYLIGEDGSVVKEKEMDINAILEDLTNRLNQIETV